ncbi:gmp synthase protein [Rutstroemia sp. NJR-2017a BVV2]|nr:gmp synthase protein [Rutstroemia sp. NJR-2017a BVV2]
MQTTDSSLRTMSSGTSDQRPKDVVRMLVLETDEPHPKTKEAKGGFGDIFHSLFKEAGDEHQPPLGIETDMHYIVNDPKNGHHGHVPHFSEIDASITAILITGSMYDAHGDDPWINELLDLLGALWVERKDMKFSGVCFGHQILSRLLGSKVEPTPGGKWELAHTEMKLTSVGQKLFKTNAEKLSLHQMHQDQVTTIPSSSTSDLLSKNDKVEVWASTEHTKIQGFYLRERLFTSQGHLGFDEDMVRRQIQMRMESGGIKDEDVAQEGKETAHLKHDGIVVAGAILRFFHGDDQNVE